MGGNAESTPRRALVLGSALQTWAESDAAGAMEWWVNRPTEFDTAIDPLTGLAILARWAAQDPATVRDFVKTMPPDAGQLRAVKAVALHLAKSDPVATMLCALSLSQPEARDLAFSTAYRQWRDDFPQQAQAWLNSADLTSEEKLRLVKYP